MKETLDLFSNTQQPEQENFTEHESQLQQKLKAEGLGQTSIDELMGGILTYGSIRQAAGLFEGEGCISSDKAQPNKRTLSMSMTDFDVMEWFVNFVGIGVLHGPCTYRTKPHALPYWWWKSVAHRDVKWILEMLSPYFFARRSEKAQEVFNHYEATY